MIISKTPYRISFFGGGSDYPAWYRENGGVVLSAAIDKYIYISCRELPPFFKHKYRVIWSKTEAVKKISQIKHNAVREMLKHYKIKKGLEIHYDGDLPARSGMGSSSVFVVGLMNVLNNYKKIFINKKKLAVKSIDFEQTTLKETVGSQDQIAAVYGGFNKIIFKTNGDFKVMNLPIHKKTIKQLNDNLILLYTGIPRTAHHIANTYVNKLKKNKKINILNILNFANEAEIALKKGDVNTFGELLHESWLEKKRLSTFISNSKIDNIYKDAISKGALGGKLLGAGGGGFFVFYVPVSKQKKFIQYFKNLVHIPFNFTNAGSKIILNNYN